MTDNITALIRELEQIGADKITQPNYKTRLACARAAELIKDLYRGDTNVVEKSTVDS